MKKLAKDAIGMAITGVTAGAGASIASSIGGTAGTNAAQGISNLTGQMSTMGTLSGMGAAFRALKKLRR